MSEITAGTVRAVARLARLQFPPDEEARMAEQLGRIVQWISVLEQLPSQTEAPSAQPVSVLREDRVIHQERPDALLANAPSTDGTSFRVPSVLHKD